MNQEHINGQMIKGGLLCKVVSSLNGFFRFFILFFVFCLLCNFSDAQTIERKIIIQNNIFYYTTIDSEFQIATLHSGKTSEPINKARHFAMPAGRSLNEPVNPFSWDMFDDMMYVINFLDHPGNDKNRALKRFALSSLHEWNKPTKDSISYMLMKSLQLEPFAMNDPYLFTIRRSPVLSNFFFDAIALNDSTYYMAIANNGEFCVWNYNGREWKQGKRQSVLIEGYFTLFVSRENLYMLSDKGIVNRISMNQIFPVTNTAIKGSMNDITLIINKEDRSIVYIRNSDLNANLELKALIAKKAISIF